MSKTNIATGDVWTYYYNSQNAMTQALETTSPGTGGVMEQDIFYRYDAFGNMIQKEVVTGGMSGTDTITDYAVDGWNPALAGATGNSNFNTWAVLNVSGSSTSLQTRNLFGDQVDEIIARIDQAGASDSAGVYWDLTDKLGSVRTVLNGSGTVVDTINYDAYGNTTSETNVADQGMYGWTGQEKDLETGLQYNNARWYDSSTGRWISQDPLGFDAGDSNLYRYVNNAPTDGTDPSGLEGENLPPLRALKDEDKIAKREGGEELKSLAGKITVDLGGGNVIKGDIRVYKNVTTASGPGRIGVGLIITDNGNEKRPAGKFHWLQVGQGYLLDGKDNEFKDKQYLFKANGLYQKTQKGLITVDTLSNDVAYEDVEGSHYRSATEITLYDRPSFPAALHKGFEKVAKYVEEYDDYLIYNDKTVLYHVHWTIVQKYKDCARDGESEISDKSITSKNINKLPDFGNKFLRGYDNYDPDTYTVSEPQYVRNPVK